jgi:hypothetical protein
VDEKFASYIGFNLIAVFLTMVQQHHAGRDEKLVYRGLFSSEKVYLSG